jgi:hypothetical protein
VSHVKYELGFYIPEDGILHSHRRENLKSYITLTGWVLSRRCKVSPVRYEQTNSVVFSPKTNYTDCATATCRRNLVPTFVDRGVSRGQRGGSPYDR